MSLITNNEPVSISAAMMCASLWWRQTRERSNLGFASCSLLGRVITEGPTGAGHVGTARVGTWLSPDVERTDKLIACMPQELREALEADVARWGSERELARRLGCSVGELQRRRASAYGWLAGGARGN